MREFWTFIISIFCTWCAVDPPGGGGTGDVDAGADASVVADAALPDAASDVYDAAPEAGPADAAVAWSPLEIAGIVAFIDPRVGATVDGAGHVSEILNQVDGEPLVNTSPGRGGRPPEDWYPTFSPAAFGSALPAIHMHPDFLHVPAVSAQWLRRRSGTLPLPDGMTVFWISKHTSADTLNNHAQNPPMTVASEGSINTFIQVGFYADQLAISFVQYSWRKEYFGSGFNDGVARVYGFQHLPSYELKAFSNGAQVGATITDAIYYPTYAGWATIGSGYRTGSPDGGESEYDGDDGMDGDLGPLIVINGPIAPDDLARFQTWAHNEGWVP